MHDPPGEVSKRVFRSKFLPGFLATIGLCGLIELAFMNYSRPHEWPHLVIAILFVAVFTGIVVFLYKITVTPEGIYAYTWYGLYRYYPWHEIVSVRHINIPGFCYIRMIPKKGAAIWVPHFLRHWKEFRDVVLEFVNDPEHPLVRYLTDHT
jgi:hypothetical protein